MLYYPLLTTLAAVRTHRDLANTTFDQQHDALLLQLLQEASSEFQEAIERTPMPYVQTRTQDWQADDWLPLDEDLLALTTLTNGDGVAIDAADTLLEPANSYPKREVLAKRSGAARFTYSGEPSQALSLAGIWGYVTHYPSAFRASGALVPAGNLAAAATSLALGTGEGALFEVGQYIAITTGGVRELMRVSAIATNTLTLVRGELGTTPALHNAGTSISVFQQRPDIAGAVRAVTVYKYLHKDEIGGRVTVISGGVVTVQDLDRSVQETIDRCRRSYFMAV